MSGYSGESLPPNILGARYHIERELASKGGRKTILAKDVENDTLLVIKLLTFSNDFVWDDLKLFEREAETLKSLSHPAIPQYLDYFEIDTENIKGFALVQSYIEANSLTQQVEAGRSFSEVEVKEIAQQILEILVYLHSRSPAVIHRDLKPSNILLGSRSGNSVGQIYLIDFGSVQSLAHKKNTTMTVVGTYGYMPPEQFGGRAKPASDLYSLGATLIYLVTGEHPADLPETDLKIEFESYCNLSPGLVDWLKQITNPSLSSRRSSATEALTALANCNNYQTTQSRKFVQPPNSKLILRCDRDSIEVIIPPKNYNWEQKSNIIALLFACLIPLIVPILALPLDISMEEMLAKLPQYLGIMLISAIGSISIIYYLSKPLLIAKKLTINTSEALFTHQIIHSTQDYIFARQRNSISKIEKNIVNDLNHSFSSISIYLNDDKFEIVNTQDYPVTIQDINWLAEELSLGLNIPLVETGINKRTSQRAEVYLRKAYDFHAKGKYEQAIEFYDLALHFDPKSYYAYLNRGVVNLCLANYQGAVEDSYMALDLNPNSAEAYCTRGAAFYYLEDYRSANKDLNLAINKEPTYKQAYYYMAITNIALKKYHTAIDNCDRVLLIDKKYSYAYLIKSKAYLRLNDYQNSIDNCDRALKINADLTEAYSIKAKAYCYGNNHQKALSTFEWLTKLKPTANNYYNLGSTQFTVAMYSEALTSFDNCLKLDDKFKFAYYARASIHHELNDLELASENYQFALELEDIIDDEEHLEDEHGYYARGLAKLHLGEDREGAVEDLNTAKEIAIAHQYTTLESKITQLIEDLES